MITDTGKTTPAPWVPFTRAGCDVGGVGTANIELENNGTTATGDITQVFGQGSPEWNEAVANPQQAQTDFVGIAIHCSQGALERLREQPGREARPPAPGALARRVTGRRLHRLQRALRSEVRRSGDHRRERLRERHERQRDHRSRRLLRLPGLRRDVRVEHAGLRRADAGERRPGHVRLHLGRARPPRSDRVERLVLELRAGAWRARARTAAEGVRHGVRELLPEPRAARDQQEQHRVRDHGRRGRPLRRRRRHAAVRAELAASTTTRAARTSRRARTTRSARSERT